MSLFIELPAHEEQTAENLRRWAELLRDPELQKWEGRVETDRHGQLIMSPPAAAEHGYKEGEIYHLLRQLLPHGYALVECPISTRDGVKIADVAWLAGERHGEWQKNVCLTRAPDICVEVFSPDNTRRQMDEKKALYFAAGAREVWFCDRKCRMLFFTESGSAAVDNSVLCPAFPREIEA